MHFSCTVCNGLVEVENDMIGKTVGCPHCKKATTVPKERIGEGVVVNNDFILKEKLGQGGAGAVYRAYQISLDRDVAVKILSEHNVSNKVFVENFIREARAAAKLNHPNIVQSFAVGQDDGIFYCAMELIVGETFKSMISREKKLTPENSLNIIRQISEGLDFAWKNQKLVHRDIKPDNIMITSSGVAKLADLGLARVASESEDESEEVMGTPQYISPEQLCGGKTDIRTDIYSLGASWYHAITGKFPFNGNSLQEIARKHLEEKLISPSQIDENVPRCISVVITKMMAKHQEDRYSDAEDLIKDLKLIEKELKSPNARRFKNISTTTSNFTASNLKITQNNLKIQAAKKGGKTKKVLILVSLILTVICVSLAAGLIKTPRAKAIDILIAKKIPQKIAEKIVDLETAISEQKLTLENHLQILKKYAEFQPIIIDKQNVLSANLTSVIDYATEKEIRELRKK